MKKKFSTAAAEARMPERYIVQRQPRWLVTMKLPINGATIGPTKTESPKTVTYAPLLALPGVRIAVKESYCNSAGLVVKQIYEHSASYSQWASSEKPCEESINQDALEIFGDGSCEVENGSPKRGDDER